jgi:hypothetical protein
MPGAHLDAPCLTDREVSDRRTALCVYPTPSGAADRPGSRPERRTVRRHVQCSFRWSGINQGETNMKKIVVARAVLPEGSGEREKGLERAHPSSRAAARALAGVQR